MYVTATRFYNPSQARWISRDPISELGGANLYAYVRNNPQAFTDLLGLAEWQFYESGFPIGPFGHASTIGFDTSKSGWDPTKPGFDPNNQSNSWFDSASP